MTQVVVPVRYPLSRQSKATLGRAIDVADQENAELTILHVNLYHNGRNVSRAELKGAVEAEFGTLPSARYVVRTGMLVEETILEEVAQRRADIIVIGQSHASRWRKMIRRIANDPDIAAFLETEVDASIVTVSE